jgi:hypothetical protein
LNPVKTLRLQSPLVAAAPSLIGERTEEHNNSTPIEEDLSQISKSLCMHDLALDAPIEKMPATTKPGQFVSLEVHRAHNQIFPPLNLTVGRNPRYTYTFQSNRKNKTNVNTIISKKRPIINKP